MIRASGDMLRSSSIRVGDFVRPTQCRKRLPLLASSAAPPPVAEQRLVVPTVQGDQQS
jgi:hypothetical protein